MAGTQLYVQQGTDGAGNPAYVPVTVEENDDPDNAGAKLLTYWFGGDIFSTAPDNEKGTAKWILRNGGYTIQKFYEHSNDSYEPLDGSEDLDTIDLYELKLDENGSPVTNANGEPVYVAVTGDPEDGKQYFKLVEGMPAGYVTRCEVDPDTVDSGKPVVKVYISLGKEEVVDPFALVVGKTLAEARTALAAYVYDIPASYTDEAGNKVETITEVYSDVAEGLVISAESVTAPTYDGDGNVTKRGVAKVVISKGHGVMNELLPQTETDGDGNTTTTYLTEAEARALLASRGYAVDEDTVYEHRNDVSKDDVI